MVYNILPCLLVFPVHFGTGMSIVRSATKTVSVSALGEFSNTEGDNRATHVSRVRSHTALLSSSVESSGTVDDTSGILLQRDLPCDGDMNLCELQAYYNATVPAPWSRWLAAQQTKFSGMLSTYTKLLNGSSSQDLVNGTQWLTGVQSCAGFRESNMSCHEMCAEVGKECSIDAMKDLNQENLVEVAFSAAGRECSSFSTFNIQGDQWDGPWISGVDSGECGYASAKIGGWKPNCEKSTIAGLSRLCACRGTGTAAPSANCLQAKKWWHQQLYQKCDANSTVPRPGPIERHFHFVVLGPRASFIRKELPLSVVTPDTKEYQALGQYERLLIDNIRYTITLNNATSVHLHDEVSCEVALAAIDKQMLVMYHREGDVRFKSDICRAAVLYLEGGVYNDDDQINYKPVFPYLKQNTTFASAQCDHELTAFASSFVAATPCHPLIREQLELMKAVRKPGIKVNDPILDIIMPEGLLGPHTLAVAYERQFGLTRNTTFVSSVVNGTQLMREARLGLVKTWLADEADRNLRNGKPCEFGYYDPDDGQAIYACSRP